LCNLAESEASLPEAGFGKLPLTVPREPRPQHAETKEDTVEVHEMSISMESKQSPGKNTEASVTKSVKGGETMNSTSSYDTRYDDED